MVRPWARHLRLIHLIYWRMVRRDVVYLMKVHYLRMVRRTFRALRHKKLRHRPWWQKLSKPLFHRSLWVPCRDTVAKGLAIGLYFSMIPFIPQSIVAAILAMRMKANVPFAVAACFISNPITNVPFWFVQIRLGQWLIETFHVHVPFEKVQVTLPGVGLVSMSNFFVGFTALGLIMALLAYPLVHLFSALLPHHLPVRRRRANVMGETPGA
jgi:uncharacterized protein (DUF2062 family)